MPSFVVEMIGVTIVLGILFILFAGTAGPMLEFTANYEAAKSFSRITTSFSTACEKGIDTILYTYIPGTKYPFAISLVPTNFANAILELELCSQDDTALCTTRTTHSNLAGCAANHCYCLLRFELGYDNFNDDIPYIFNDSFDIIVGKRAEDMESGDYHFYGESILNRLDWEDTYGEGKIQKIEAIRCVEIKEICSSNGSPVPFEMYEEGIFIWMHTRGLRTDTSERVHDRIYFSSFSPHRAVSTTHVFEYDNYFNVYTSPIYEVVNIGDVNYIMNT